MFELVLRQTLVQAFRKGGGAFGTCAFYVMIITFFTFALGPEGIRRHAGAVMCVAMLLSSVIALPLFYETDYEDGTLEQYLLWPLALEFLVLAKILGHWLSIILPILILSPLMAILANLKQEQWLPALRMLLLASPTMVAVGSVSAAITIGTKRGGLLQALITLPLYIPILIFAASSQEQGAALLLAGMACASVPLSCIVSAILVKIGVE